MSHPQWDAQSKETKLLGLSKDALLEILEKVNWDPEKLYLELTKLVGWQRTGKEIFEAIMFYIFPAVPSECAIVHIINSEPHVLMWQRDDEHYTGSHLPGKYILRGESDEEWIHRTLANETGLELKSFEFIRRFNTRPGMGWTSGQQINHLWYCEVEGEPTKGEFYPLTAIPVDTLGHHKKYVDSLRAFLLRRETMYGRGIRWDGKVWPNQAPEWKWTCKVIDQLDGMFNHVIHDTLDEALLHMEQCDSPVILFDDQGWEVTRSNLP